MDMIARVIVIFQINYPWRKTRQALHCSPLIQLFHGRLRRSVLFAVAAFSFLGRPLHHRRLDRPLQGPRRSASELTRYSRRMPP